MLCCAQAANLDRGLTAAQRAEAAAFGALVEARLQPAIAYTTWCEGSAYVAHTRPAYGAAMPFPLSYFVPRAQRRAVQQHFTGMGSSQVGWLGRSHQRHVGTTCAPSRCAPQHLRESPGQLLAALYLIPAMWSCHLPAKSTPQPILLAS